MNSMKMIIIVYLAFVVSRTASKKHFTLFDIASSICTISGEESPCFREQFTSLSNYETEQMVVAEAERFCNFRKKSCNIEKMFSLCCENPYSARIAPYNCRGQ
ncbi:hypothetical protein QR680_000498 [Steinernema hermaphroditum]|uniref:Uncharacterized protein n=1 Tax=Steinernema hermaphroditum TaxID=289476 RepID=A0AA39GWC3_9BILA|nr:hypothetical protein QR680_000498 [Steinernema hermaphroditum]